MGACGVCRRGVDVQNPSKDLVVVESGLEREHERHGLDEEAPLAQGAWLRCYSNRNFADVVFIRFLS